MQTCTCYKLIIFDCFNCFISFLFKIIIKSSYDFKEGEEREVAKLGRQGALEAVEVGGQDQCGDVDAAADDVGWVAVKTIRDLRERGSAYVGLCGHCERSLRPKRVVSRRTYT